MNKSLKIGFLVVILIFAYLSISSYNNLVSSEEKISESWAQVESNLQRKIDLLPNLVKSVKAYTKHETELLTQITELRASALQRGTTPSKEQIQNIQKINKSIRVSTLKLFAVAENYPNLQSSEQFLRLQSQIEGAENRVNITRMQYNTSVKEFNALVRKFPSNIVASLGGFEKKEYFKVDAEVHKKFKLDI